MKMIEKQGDISDTSMKSQRNINKQQWKNQWKHFEKMKH